MAIFDVFDVHKALRDFHASLCKLRSYTNPSADRGYEYAKDRIPEFFEVEGVMELVDKGVLSFYDDPYAIQCMVVVNNEIKQAWFFDYRA